MAEIAAFAPVNLAVVGFRAYSTTLSDPEKYPTFIRVNFRLSAEAHAIANLMQRAFCDFQFTVGLVC